MTGINTSCGYEPDCNRIVSLWDMLQEFAFPFCDSLTIIRKLEDLIKEAKQLGEQYLIIDPEKLSEIGAYFNEMRKYLLAVPLPHTMMHLTHMQSVQTSERDRYNWNQLSHDMKALDFYLRSELQETLVFRIPLERKNFISYSFGPEVSESFPSCVREIESAGTCFAIKEYQASVFHLMRILERGLSVLASKFSVSFERGNWHNIIEQVELKIRKMNSSCGPDWKEQQKFCSQAASQFMFVKDAWRNHIVHVRIDVYDEGRTLSIFRHVEELMKALAVGGLKELPDDDFSSE